MTKNTNDSNNGKIKTELSNDNNSKKLKSKSESYSVIKKEIYKLYNIMYDKYTPYDVIISDDITNAIETLINDDKIQPMVFADYLLRYNINTLSKLDLKNRTTKRNYTRRIKKFNKKFVDTLNESYWLGINKMVDEIEKKRNSKDGDNEK